MPDVVASTTYNGVSTALDPSEILKTVSFTPIITKAKDANGAEIEGVYDFNTLWGENFLGTVLSRPTLYGQYLYAGRVTVNEDLSLSFEIDPLFTIDSGKQTGTYDPCTNTFMYDIQATLPGYYTDGSAFVIDTHVVLTPKP